MAEWKNCVAEILYYGNDEADTDSPCEVVIDGGKVVVTYEDDGLVKYEGKEIGPGHYDLNLVEGDGHATLHRFPESKIMEGYWTEDSERGMWRIRLKK